MIERPKRKKVCIAIHSLAHAGAERVAASWANYLVTQGHDVSVIVYANSDDTYVLNDDVNIVPISSAKEEYFSMSAIKKLFCIRKVVKKERPQILISFLPKMQITMMLATFGMRIKRIETVRNNPWIDKDVGKKRFLWNLCFHKGDRIIVQTNEQSLYFSENVRKKCIVISNPISKEFYDIQKVYNDDKIKKFVAVARLNTQKNYPMMIQAFSQVVHTHPEITLDIYGNGTSEAQQEMEKLICSLGMENNIHLCGWRKDIASLLPQYDAFLMSSNYEGMPNALAEAMATGLVCLSTDCRTGPKDMIDHGKCGFLAKTGDADSFAKEIKEIVNLDIRQCENIGLNAREKILEMCSDKNTLARLKHLIEDEL